MKIEGLFALFGPVSSASPNGGRPILEYDRATDSGLGAADCLEEISQPGAERSSSEGKPGLDHGHLVQSGHYPMIHTAYQSGLPFRSVDEVGSWAVQRLGNAHRKPHTDGELHGAQPG